MGRIFTYDGANLRTFSEPTKEKGGKVQKNEHFRLFLASTLLVKQKGSGFRLPLPVFSDETSGALFERLCSLLAFRAYIP